MRERFVEITPHKRLYIRIDESPGFGCHIRQFFIDDMESFKKRIVNEADSSVMMGFTYPEFCIVAEEIIAYMKELEESNQLVKELVEAPHETSQQ